MQEKNSSLSSPSLPPTCDQNISFSFLLRPSCSLAGRREIPGTREQSQRHVGCTLWVSMAKFSSFPSASPKLLGRHCCCCCCCCSWVDLELFYLSICWSRAPDPACFSYACGVFTCKHWALGLLSIWIQRKSCFQPYMAKHQRVSVLQGYILLQGELRSNFSSKTFFCLETPFSLSPVFFFFLSSLLYWDKIFIVSMTAEDGSFCWNFGFSPFLEGFKGLSSACLESISPIAGHSRRAGWALCPEMDKDFLLDPGLPGEWNGLVWPRSPASLFFCLQAGRRKMLIQQARDKISTGENARGVSWLHFCQLFLSFFHPDFLIFCTQQIHLTKSGFQNQWMLHFIHFKDFLPQTTKRVGNCAWSQTQTEPIFLRNLSKVVIQPNRDKNWWQWLLWRFLWFFYRLCEELWDSLEVSFSWSS